MWPPWINATPSRKARLEVPWLPSWVARPVFSASLRSARASCAVWVSGFSQKTGRPWCMAHADATAWVWSGVATITPSRSRCIVSSIRRKSVNALASGIFEKESPALSLLTSHKATTRACSGMRSTNHLPRPPTPMMATRTSSLTGAPRADRGLPRIINPPPAPARLPRNRRRVFINN